VRENASSAPSGLLSFPPRPTAYAVGFILAPLRGSARPDLFQSETQLRLLMHMLKRWANIVCPLRGWVVRVHCRVPSLCFVTSLSSAGLCSSVRTRLTFLYSVPTAYGSGLLSVAPYGAGFYLRYLSTPDRD
jgi:hypothetical protein